MGTTHVDFDISSPHPQRARRIIAPSRRGRGAVREDGLVVRVRGAVGRVPVDGELGRARGDVHLLGVGTLVDEDALVRRRGRREGVDGRLHRRVSAAALGHV